MTSKSFISFFLTKKFGKYKILFNFAIQSAFYMKTKQPLEDLKEIRRMMETSSKFLSLSGLSGISAGLVALIGAGYAHYIIRKFELKLGHFFATGRIDEAYSTLEFKLFFIALLILIFAVGFGFLFTYLTAKKKQQSLFTPVAFKLAFSLGLPLAFGGLFVILLYLKGYYLLIAPLTLLFYGLGLLNASKYVHIEIKYLAIIQMTLGLLALWFEPYSLYIWAFGFGVMHIIYGIIMYYKYEKQ